MNEKQFQQQVIDWAKFNHWLVYHPHDSRHSQAGFPDLAMARDGRLVFAELKTARGRVSAAQREWLAALAASGCETHVWRPADWLTIERTLARVACRKLRAGAERSDGGGS